MILSAEEAERMSGRVDHDPDVILWLVIGQRSASRGRPPDSRIEIADGDVEVHGDMLLARLTRPDGPGVLLFVLEVQPRTDLAWRRTHLSPAVFWRVAGPRGVLRRYRPLEHPRVEGCQIARIGRADRHRGDVHPGRLSHLISPRNRRHAAAGSRDRP